MTARDIFIYLSGIFWLGLGYVAVKCPHAPAPAVGFEAPKSAGNRAITLVELARHDKATDCWMAIDGKVYELHGFIDIHPSAAGVMEPYCGKEASAAYAVIDRGKHKGQRHSARSDELLAEYRVGDLARE